MFSSAVFAVSMAFYCCFSFITQQKFQVSSLVCVFWPQWDALWAGGGVAGLAVMWAAADRTDRLPFDAQEVQAVITRLKLTYFCLCLCPLLPPGLTASEQHRFPFRTRPQLCFECRRHRLHRLRRGHTHNQSSASHRAPRPVSARQPGLEVR